MIKPVLAGAVALMSLNGCVSSLDVQRFNPNISQVGYPYRLRLTQYEVAVTWRVTECTNQAQHPLKIKVTAEAKEGSALDPDQFYVIDPRSLQGLFRTTDFSMDWYEDRTPKSISSSVDDQTGAAITNVLTGVAKLAAAGLVPAGGRPIACKQEVLDALEGINGVRGNPRKPSQEALTKAAQKTVAAQTLVVTRLAAQAASAGAAISDELKTRLDKASAKLETLTDALTAEQATLKEMVDVVSETRTFKWPERGSEYASVRFAPSPKSYKKWGLDSSETSVFVFLRLVPLDWGGDSEHLGGLRHGDRTEYFGGRAAADAPDSASAARRGAWSGTRRITAKLGRGRARTPGRSRAAATAASRAPAAA